MKHTNRFEEIRGEDTRGEEERGQKERRGKERKGEMSSTTQCAKLFPNLVEQQHISYKQKKLSYCLRQNKQSTISIVFGRGLQNQPGKGNLPTETNSLFIQQVVDPSKRAYISYNLTEMFH